MEVNISAKLSGCQVLYTRRGYCLDG